MTHQSGSKRTYKDPLTGDELSLKEYVTRQLQQGLRSPWFLVLFHLTLLVAWLTGHMEAWNYFASTLAVDVEWLVGTFNFGQQGRDAVITRQILKVVLEELQELKHGTPAEDKQPD